MALSGGRGENKQKLIKILVFVPSGSIVGFDSQCQAQIKTDISKPFVLGSPQYAGGAELAEGRLSAEHVLRYVLTSKAILEY